MYTIGTGGPRQWGAWRGSLGYFRMEVWPWWEMSSARIPHKTVPKPKFPIYPPLIKVLKPVGRVLTEMDHFVWPGSQK